MWDAGSARPGNAHHGFTPPIPSSNQNGVSRIRGVWRSGAPYEPTRAACSGGRPAERRPAAQQTSSPGSRQRHHTTWRRRAATAAGHRRACLCGHADRPLPLSPARTRPGGSLGQRGDRMAPLRWGTGDHDGAASGDDGRRDVRDASSLLHREEDFILTAQKRPGPPLQSKKRRSSEENRRLVCSGLLHGHRTTNLRCQSVSEQSISRFVDSSTRQRHDPAIG
jgi:hypothetical protein